MRQLRELILTAALEATTRMQLMHMLARFGRHVRGDFIQQASKAPRDFNLTHSSIHALGECKEPCACEITCSECVLLARAQELFSGAGGVRDDEKQIWKSLMQKISFYIGHLLIKADNEHYLRAMEVWRKEGLETRITLSLDWKMLWKPRRWKGLFDRFCDEMRALML